MAPSYLPHTHTSAGAFLWQQLKLSGDDVETFGDAFYFAVETFLTIGYGDISPASTLAKVFFIVFTLTSLVVQLTVLSTVLSSSLEFCPDPVCPHTPGPVRSHSRERPCDCNRPSTCCKELNRLPMTGDAHACAGEAVPVQEAQPRVMLVPRPCALAAPAQGGSALDCVYLRYNV